MATLVKWYEVKDTGDLYCEDCRAEMLRDWSPAAVKAKGGNSEEMVRPSDFAARGRRPWAGSPKGYRYMQCDRCCGQWGPDA